ncbi:hypothetical protein UF75_5330 [Desulfosporosinus sp. I2]|uniref:hypothetical protein n=1 Tax=Desulfosporosinus sp. I2 TaxID=1617025 RepID=UPI0005EE9918|nr:hypothetical protein [Desulfosporosinus sp. I2]KJR44294.1 hypothetical protein UF75_5330 [Desulfosporosinus sp. I2]
MDAEETKDAIREFINNVDDEGLKKLWKFIYVDFEVVATEEDIKAIERGEQEIMNGELRRL